MTADKMFAELGYKKIADNGKTMIYQQIYEDSVTKTITFYTRDHDITIEMYVEDDPLMITLSVAELQAIMAKIKELGWE